MTSKVFTYKGSWEAARWMGVDSAIKRTALALDLDCKTEVCKGFIFESGIFKVSGDYSSICRFKEWLKNAVSDF